MRRVVGVLLLLSGAMAAWGQDAPFQAGPTPGSVVEDTSNSNAVAVGGYRMEPGMTAPKIVQAVAAEYPKDLPVVVGTVRCTLSMVIDEKGTPLFIRVVHSAGAELDAAAILAVRQSKFEAGLREQKAVPIRTSVRVVFTADHAPALPEILKPPPGGTGDATSYDVPPKVTYQAEARFSDEARRKRIDGNVVVSILVTEAGSVTDVRVVRGLGYGLDEKAMEAVRKFKFQPAMKDGMPVAARLNVDVNFHIYH